MPWKPFHHGDYWDVYKVDAQGRPTGNRLGRHDTKEDANDQIAALHIHVHKASGEKLQLPPPAQYGPKGSMVAAVSRAYLSALKQSYNSRFVPPEHPGVFGDPRFRGGNLPPLPDEAWVQKRWSEWFVNNTGARVGAMYPLDTRKVLDAGARIGSSAGYVVGLYKAFGKPITGMVLPSKIAAIGLAMYNNFADEFNRRQRARQRELLAKQGEGKSANAKLLKADTVTVLPGGWQGQVRAIIKGMDDLHNTVAGAMKLLPPGAGGVSPYWLLSVSLNYFNQTLGKARDRLVFLYRPRNPQSVVREIDGVLTDLQVLTPQLAKIWEAIRRGVEANEMDDTFGRVAHALGNLPQHIVSDVRRPLRRLRQRAETAEPGVLSVGARFKLKRMMSMQTKTHASKPFYLSLKDVKALCPDCAVEMQRHNLKSINVQALPPAIKQKLGRSDPGFFTRCMGHDFGRSFSNKEAFCAWLHKRVVGKYPSERSTQLSTRQSIRRKRAAATAKARAMKIIYKDPRKITTKELEVWIRALMRDSQYNRKLEGHLLQALSIALTANQLDNSYAEIIKLIRNATVYCTRLFKDNKELVTQYQEVLLRRTAAGPGAR